jgi:hypothetical protein
MAFHKENTAMIFLGASSFPSSTKFKSSIAFKHAKDRIKKFVLTNILAESEDNILDLFDSNYSPDEIDSHISGFIKGLKNNIKELIIYYVGHGSFDKTSFILTTRKTRDENLSVSSITAQSIGTTISKAASNLKVYVILDCCFAASLYTIFQSPLIEIVSKDISDNFPPTGLALLCASSKDDPARIISERQITMFSEGLEFALRNGAPEIRNELLTLRELGDLTYSHIKLNNPGEAIRPEVHSPIMPHGDIADIPVFPNYAFKSLVVTGVDLAYNITARRTEITKQIISNNVILASKLFLDFIIDFDTDSTNIIDATIISSQCNSLEEDKPSKIAKEEYAAYKEERTSLYRKMLEMISSTMKS